MARLLFPKPVKNWTDNWTTDW